MLHLYVVLRPYEFVASRFTEHRTQRKTALMGKPAWTKRDKTSGEFMAEKKSAKSSRASGARSDGLAGQTASSAVSRISRLPKRLQPMLATLTDGPFDDTEWVFEDKYDGFRMVAVTDRGTVTLYSRSPPRCERSRKMSGTDGRVVIASFCECTSKHKIHSRRCRALPNPRVF
jgi:hypothetical protein